MTVRDLTLSQAHTELIKLGERFTASELRTLLNRVKLDDADGVTGHSHTLLYSGGIGEFHSTELVEHLGGQNTDLLTINKTHFGNFATPMATRTPSCGN